MIRIKPPKIRGVSFYERNNKDGPCYNYNLRFFRGMARGIK